MFTVVASIVVIIWALRNINKELRLTELARKKLWKKAGENEP